MCELLFIIEPRQNLKPTTCIFLVNIKPLGPPQVSKFKIGSILAFRVLCAIKVRGSLFSSPQFPLKFFAIFAFCDNCFQQFDVPSFPFKNFGQVVTLVVHSFYFGGYVLTTSLLLQLCNNSQFHCLAMLLITF